MRSPAEIAWRLRQEIENIWLWVRPPNPVAAPPYAPLERLPEPHRLAAALQRSPFLAELTELADRIVSHRFPLLGLEIETGPEIAWRRDYPSGIETRPVYFRRIAYLDARRSGDHKRIWELNRHQHLVVLAQAWLGTGRRRYLEEIRAQLESWVAANPYARGINWASALEVAFRALSWTWVYHLAGAELEEEFRRRLLVELYRHGCYIETNLSVYFSPNTHLLIEAVALHALGKLFSWFPRAERWRRSGADLVRAQLAAQVRDDGSHFEQSTYYQLYALDAFLFHALVEDVDARFRERLAEMARWLAAVAGPERELPFLGDDDGGRFFYPYGVRSRFARATLATAALVAGAEVPFEPEDLFEQALWWIGPQTLEARPHPGAAERRSQLFADSGLAVLGHDSLHAVFDAGPFGPGSAGHSHSDTLSLVLRYGGAPVLIDPGTYTYVCDALWRQRFRGSAAHNTLRIDESDQAEPAGPFRWRNPPSVERRVFTTTAEYDFVEAVCRYRGFSHRRRLLLLRDPLLVVVFDDVDAETRTGAAVSIEQFWHTGLPPAPLTSYRIRLGDSAAIGLAGGDAIEFDEGGEYGWRSPVFGVKTPAPVLRVIARRTLPAGLAAVFVFRPDPPELALGASAAGWNLTAPAPALGLEFPRTGGWRRLAP